MRSHRPSPLFLVASGAAILLGAGLPRTATGAPREHMLSWAACKSGTGFQNSVSFANGGLHYVGPNNPAGPYNLIQCSIVRDNVTTSTGLAGLQVAYSSSSTIVGDVMSCQLTSFTDRWKGTSSNPMSWVAKTGPI